MLYFVRFSESYRYVVPQMACFSLKPDHNSSAQMQSSAFKVSVGTKYYHPNDLIKGFFLISIFIDKIILISIDYLSNY